MSNSQRFKALFFDFDETLVPEYEASDAAVEELSAEIRKSHPLEHDLRLALRTVANRLIDETPMGAITVEAFGPGSIRWAADELVWDDKTPLPGLSGYLPEFRRQVWTEALESVGIADARLAQAMSERLPGIAHRNRVPYADAEKVLSTFGSRYPMAILTNGEPIIQAHKVENSGLKHHFTHVVLCHEHGGKPEPKPFQVALDLLGVQPGEVAMIGNSIETDITGARNAGIYSVWVNHGPGKESPSGDVRPDATIRHLSELLDLF